jgi:hypothetical protein
MVINKRLTGVSIAVIVLLVAVITPGLVRAAAVPPQDVTCPKDSPWTKIDDNKVGDNDNSLNKINWTAPSGYVISEVCVKGGQDKEFFTANGSDSNSCWKVKGIGTSSATAKKIGEGSNCKDISHASFKVVKMEGGYYFQFAKEWAGDKINLDNVDVTFKIGDISWKIGDLPVAVEPGQTLEPISEVVTGLPENCEYTSDLPTSFTIPGNIEEEVRRETFYENGETYTLTAVNTVNCEEVIPEEDTPQVLGQTTTSTPTVAATTTQVTATPVGGVSAGAGGSNSNISAIFGLFGSMLALGAGIVRKVTM